MKSIAALDVGQKHIGLAISDVMRMSVAPVGDISRKPPRMSQQSIDKVSKAIQRFVDKHNVGGIVIGFPLTPDGGVTRFCEEIVNLVSRLDCKQPLIPTPAATGGSISGGGNSGSVLTNSATVAAESPHNNREPLLCTFWDERNSTVGARRVISQMSSRRSVVSKYKDSVAACLILDGFLKG